MDDTSPPDGSPVPGDPIDDVTGEASGGRISEPSGAAAGPVEAGNPLPDPRVQAAFARLARLDDLDVDEHVQVYDAIHRDLRDALTGAASRDPSVSG